ncbi:MAG TPA: 4-alpha-glucanotransferase [Gallionellaceae bacterium]
MRFPRSSGILLHPTSLPGRHGSGDLGTAAFHFVDWMATAGQKLWQILPLGGIGPGNSPYMSSSAFAGNVLLIDLDELHAHGWLHEDELVPHPGFSAGRVDYSLVFPYRMERLRLAARRFLGNMGGHQAEFEAFCAAEQAWLEDYALFKTLAEHHGWQDWCLWPAPLARREPEALRQAALQYADEIGFWCFCQWCFFRQWRKLKAHANSRGIQIIGDMPIFIAYQSAEVWARPELFQLGADRRPTVVAGVPPDYFSATGQRWGNPLYLWSVHEQENFAWWIKRMQKTMELVDIVRIDHFRGFAGYWEIPASEPTAIQGRWVPGPGDKLFHAIYAALGRLPIIAEDLGVVTPDVVALLEKFSLPGMRVLQFAFGDGPNNPYLPHNYINNTVVYGGTHDNDTTLSWFATATPRVRAFACAYLNSDGSEINWDLIRAASRSVADIVIHPMQDVLDLGTGHRMNLPGTSSGYWEWRFSWEQVGPQHGERLHRITALYGRCPAEQLKL